MEEIISLLGISYYWWPVQSAEKNIDPLHWKKEDKVERLPCKLTKNLRINLSVNVCVFEYTHTLHKHGPNQTQRE